MSPSPGRRPGREPGGRRGPPRPWRATSAPGGSGKRGARREEGQAVVSNEIGAWIEVDVRPGWKGSAGARVGQLRRLVVVLWFALGPAHPMRVHHIAPPRRTGVCSIAWLKSAPWQHSKQQAGSRGTKGARDAPRKPGWRRRTGRSCQSPSGSPHSWHARRSGAAGPGRLRSVGRAGPSGGSLPSPSSWIGRRTRSCPDS